MNYIKILLHKLGLIKDLVWTEDSDGEVRLRKAYTSPFGNMICRSILFKNVILLPDGRTKGCIYVRRWKRY